MTYEQKPESPKFRAREAQIADLAFEISDWKSYDDNEDITIARAHIAEAEARGAAEQRRKDEPEFEKIIAERDEAEDFIRKMAGTVLGEAVEWSNVYGFQNALNDVSERIWFLEKDAEGAEPVGYASRGGLAQLASGKGVNVQNIYRSPDNAWPIPLYDRPANAAVLEARVMELEGALSYLKDEALRFADMYPQSSDMRNTFGVFASKIAARAAAIREGGE